MASYLLRVQTIQRAAGRSAVAAAAYRSGQGLVDERLAMEFDFAGKAGVEFSEIRLPDGAPAALSDRQTLWNAAEKAEARKDAVPARELLVALPHELDFEQRRALVRDFVDRHVTAHGMIADVALHVPGQEGDQRNFHAHILLTTRRVTPDGFGPKDPAWRTPRQVRDWRAGWAEIQNEHLRRHLGPNAPQVSHQTLCEALAEVVENAVGPGSRPQGGLRLVGFEQRLFRQRRHPGDEVGVRGAPNPVGFILLVGRDFPGRTQRHAGRDQLQHGDGGGYDGADHGDLHVQAPGVHRLSLTSPGCGLLGCAGRCGDDRRELR